MPLSRLLPWLLAFVLLSLGAWGSRPLWEPDEGRYGEAAREMAVGGDWLVPRLRGEAHLTKPPLIYWLSAAGLRLTGVGPGQPVGNAWGARLATSLAFLGTILCIVALGRTWGWNEKEALLAGLIFGTSALPFGAGHILTTDMLLAFWETLGVLCAWRVWTGIGDSRLWRWWFWIAFGLAFLTKGPPGLLPLLALIACRKLHPVPPRARLWSWAGLVVMLVIAALWYLAIAYRMPGQFGRFVREEVINRVASNDQNRAKPFYFYFAVAPLGMAPWLFLWPGFFAGMAGRLNPGGEEGGEGGWFRRLGRRIVALKPAALFSLLWVGIAMIVFQLSVSKMPLYIVPLMPPVALWMARIHWRIFPQGWPAGTGARRAMIGLAVAWIFCLCFGATLPDGFSRGDSYVELAQSVRKLPLPPGKPLHVFGGTPDSVAFYSGRLLEERSVSVGPYMRMIAAEAAAGPAYLLIHEDELEELRDRKMPWRAIAQQRKWVLAEILPSAK